MRSGGIVDLPRCERDHSVDRRAPAIRDPISHRLGKSELATSHLTRLECRSKPLAARNVLLVRAFDQFFAGQNMLLCGLTIAIIDEATMLRAKYNLKTPDSIHLATAVMTKVTAFLTGARNLARVSEVPVEIV